MADNPPTAPGSAGQGRGGRRRGRGGAPPSGRIEGQPSSSAGAGRGSKSRGRGGRGPGGRDKQQGTEESRKEATQSQANTAMVGTKQVAAATDDADDGEVCFICASTVEHTSVSPCNHRTCHICALRLRALYKSKGCAHCRVSLSIVGEDLFSFTSIAAFTYSANIWGSIDRVCICDLHRRPCTTI